jgi:hypothetical protein
METRDLDFHDRYEDGGRYDNITYINSDRDMWQMADDDDQEYEDVDWEDADYDE